MISFLPIEEPRQITVYMSDLVLQKSELTSSYPYSFDDYQVDNGIDILPLYDINTYIVTLVICNLPYRTALSLS